MKEEGVVDKVEQTIYLTQIEEEDIFIRKSMREIAPFCSICDIHFRNLAERHGLGVKRSE